METNRTVDTEIERVRRLGAAFADQVEQVAEHHWDRATPCPAWAVRELVAHVASIVDGLEALATGAPRPAAVPTAGLGPGAQIAARIRADLARGVGAWHHVDRDSPRDFPWGRTPAVRALQFTSVELAGHGWDLMVATGVAPAFGDDDLAAVIMTVTQLIPPVAAPGLFAPPATVPGTARAIDRMAAASGRRISIPSPA